MQRTWSFRLEAESLFWDKKCFVTLTYDPAKYNGNSLSPSHLTNFWKRLRKRLEPYKIKYFACGEYGDKFGRPHYHALIYGLDENDRQIIEDSWNFGFVQIGTFTDKSVRYVSGYCLKKLGKDKDRYKNRELWPEFIRASQGIGVQFIEQIPQFCTYVNFNGRIQYLGRYLTNKLAYKFFPYDDLETHRNPVRQIMIEDMFARLEDLQSKYKANYDNLETWQKEQCSLLKYCYDCDTIQFKRNFIAKFKLNSRIINEKIEIQSFAPC